MESLKLVSQSEETENDRVTDLRKLIEQERQELLPLGSREREKVHRWISMMHPLREAPLSAVLPAMNRCF